MIKVLIVDDEPLAREELRLMLQAEPDLQIVAECGHAIEALPAIHQHKPDVLFLDIQMPRISGLELVGMLDPEQLPQIVFVTAYDEYALRAFEEQALDYLLKPVDPARLARTLARLRAGQGQSQRAQDWVPPLTQIPCVGHNRIRLLPITEVEFVHSDVAGNHVISQSMEGTTELTLRTLEERSGFLRCHRQYLVNPRCISEILLLEGGLAELLTQSGRKIPVSRRYLKPLKEYLAIP